MQQKIRNKKGSIIDIAFIIIALFGLAIFIGVIVYVFPQITTQISASPLGNNSASAAALDTTESLMDRMGSVFLIIFVGLTIGVFITAYQIDSSPAFIPLYIILLALLITVASVIQYSYNAFEDNSVLGTTQNAMVSLLMSKLVLIAVGIGVMSMILIFAKPKPYGGAF